MEPRGRNRWQPVPIGSVEKALKQPKTVAMGCDRLPKGAHGRRGRPGGSRDLLRQQTGSKRLKRLRSTVRSQLLEGRGAAWIERSRTERRRRCDSRSGLPRRRSRVRVPSLPSLKVPANSIFCCPNRRKSPYGTSTFAARPHLAEVPVSMIYLQMSRSLSAFRQRPRPSSEKPVIGQPLLRGSTGNNGHTVSASSTVTHR
jgi:hypothetical protein